MLLLCNVPSARNRHFYVVRRQICGLLWDLVTVTHSLCLISSTQCIILWAQGFGESECLKNRPISVLLGLAVTHEANTVAVVVICCTVVGVQKCTRPVYKISYDLSQDCAMDRCKWRKMIKDVWWSGWVWVGECFFWYRPARVVPDKRPLNGCVCVCVITRLSYVYHKIDLQ